MIISQGNTLKKKTHKHTKEIHELDCVTSRSQLCLSQAKGDTERRHLQLGARGAVQQSSSSLLVDSLVK